MHASENTSRSTKKKNKRKRYVINAAFQWRHTLALATGVFVVAAMMGVLLFGTLHRYARARTLAFAPAESYSYAPMVFLFALGFSILLIGALCIWGILITHRVSGPLFVLQNHLRVLAQGRFPNKRALRKRDEFKEVHDDFWTAVDHAKDERQADLSELTELAAAARTAPREEPDRQAEVLAMIAGRIDKIRIRYATSLGIELDTAGAKKANKEAQTKGVLVGSA